MADGLHPSVQNSRTIRVSHALPIEARNSGRILDFDLLEAGDLLLFRPADADRADWISKWIVSAQTEAGFAARDARWTHAAVYLGDGESICESNIGVTGFNDGVMVRSGHAYCDMETVVRARRPKDMSQKERVRIAIGALTNYGKEYSIRQAWQFRKAAWRGEGFWSNLDRGPKISVKALVCSTLYQDALTFARQGNSVRMGTYCTPAHLSASTEFLADDVPLGWIGIE